MSALEQYVLVEGWTRVANQEISRWLYRVATSAHASIRKNGKNYVGDFVPAGNLLKEEWMPDNLIAVLTRGES